jgi:RNA polymerase sigma-70 factor (ECF subfamily)
VVARLDAQQRLLEALLVLPEPYRSTLFYRYVDGLSGAEIARCLGVTEETVRARLLHGQRLLKERLGGDARPA